MSGTSAADIESAIDALASQLDDADLSYVEIFNLRHRISELDRLLLLQSMRQPETFGEGGDY